MTELRENIGDLGKLNKLLDRIESELKKKREEKIYNQTEKFIEHMKKASFFHYPLSYYEHRLQIFILLSLKR